MKLLRALIWMFRGTLMYVFCPGPIRPLMLTVFAALSRGSGSDKQANMIEEAALRLMPRHTRRMTFTAEETDGSLCFCNVEREVVTPPGACKTCGLTDGHDLACPCYTKPGEHACPDCGCTLDVCRQFRSTGKRACCPDCRGDRNHDGKANV